MAMVFRVYSCQVAESPILTAEKPTPSKILKPDESEKSKHCWIRYINSFSEFSWFNKI